MPLLGISVRIFCAEFTLRSGHIAPAKVGSGRTRSSQEGRIGRDRTRDSGVFGFAKCNGDALKHAAPLARNIIEFPERREAVEKIRAGR